MKDDSIVIKGDILSSLIDRVLADDYDSDTLSGIIDLVYVSRDPRPLLKLLSGSVEAQINGINILAEIGKVAYPLLETAVEFTVHPSWEARFWALNCILSCAERSDGPALAAGVRLLGDQEPRVRKKAVDFVARLTSVKIEAARDALSCGEDGTDFAGVLSRLLSYSYDTVDSMMGDAKSDDWLRRASALAFAARGVLAAKRIARKGARSSDLVTSEIAKTLL
jgi:hypothetical protein